MSSAGSGGNANYGGNRPWDFGYPPLRVPSAPVVAKPYRAPINWGDIRDAFNRGRAAINSGYNTYNRANAISHKYTGNSLYENGSRAYNWLNSNHPEILYGGPENSVALRRRY